MRVDVVKIEGDFDQGCGLMLLCHEKREKNDVKWSWIRDCESASDRKKAGGWAGQFTDLDLETTSNLDLLQLLQKTLYRYYASLNIFANT